MKTSKEIYQRNKEELIAYFGSKCNCCGKKNKKFNFHHINEKDKSFNISSRLSTRKIESIIDEVNKCEMLCTDCHKAKHPKIYKKDGYTHTNRWYYVMTNEQRILYNEKRKIINRATRARKKARLQQVKDNID